MPEQARRPGFSISFFGMVGAVMAALKLKEHWERYNQPEGRVALHSPTEDDEAVSLLNTELPTHRVPKTKRGKGCCVCCGMNCGLFCKALGIVTALFVIWYGIKLVIWAVTPSPTGLENMPVYSTSLGCLDAPYLYKDEEETIISVPMGYSESDHGFDVTGSAVGTFVIAEGPADLTEVQYKVALRSDDKNILEQIKFTYPTEQGTENSRLRIGTPAIPSSSKSCVRFDITMYVPPSLKKLHIASHVPVHVKFDDASNSNVLDDLIVTLYASNENNMILPHQNMTAKNVSLEVYRGWIVGAAAIVDSTSIATQQGDGVANVRVYPVAPEDPSDLKTATLQTATGAGRTDIFFINEKSLPHRPISSGHTSSRNGDVYLTYKEAEFSGLVSLKSSSFSATGLQSLAKDSTNEWTHWVGDKEGGDRITVSSRGWTGLYF